MGKIYPGGQFEYLRDYSFTVDTYTPELRRLKGGPFIKKVLDDCYKSKEGTMDPVNRKLFMYSAHDTTVAPILHTLNVFDPPKAPPYAAMIIFELIQRDNFYLRLSYKNESESEPYVLTVPGCEELCPLDTFKELMTPMLPVDWEAECGFQQQNIVEKRITLVAALVSSVMAAAVVVSLFFVLCRRKRDEDEIKYQRIDQADKS